ncbi:MAG TPA: hypothetical protein VGK36_08850 [Candidatus Angelobacter sp.]|jgi:hypothetical protein
MKRILYLLLLCAAPILFVTSGVTAFGQGACYPAGVVLLDTGRPANGAGIRVCTAGSTGTPCTPTASLFTDPTLGTPLPGSPVVTADAHGNFGFCAAAGNNYDLQISGTGITTLTIRNLPLPPTSPINAASLTSSSANPANVGTIKLASGDCLDWRNNANTGNIQLCKTSSDQLDVTNFPSVIMPGLVIMTSGSNSVTSQVDLGRAAAESEIAIPATTGSFFTNSDLVGGDMIVRVDGSTHRIYLGTGTGIAPIAVTNTGLNFYGSTSGAISVKAPATAGSNTVTWPAATGNVVLDSTIPSTLLARAGQDDQTAKSTSISTTSIGTALAAGRYTWNIAIGTTATDASGATYSYTISWTQDGISRSFPLGGLTFASTAQQSTVTAGIFVDNGTNVSYSVTVTGTPTTGRYAVHAWTVKN